MVIAVSNTNDSSSYLTPLTVILAPMTTFGVSFTKTFIENNLITVVSTPVTLVEMRHSTFGPHLHIKSYVSMMLPSIA